MRFWDFVVIVIFVLVFGISSSIYPAYFAARIKSLVRND
jgi:ABC-type lipoprotein release transport system permease subunit